MNRQVKAGKEYVRELTTRAMVARCGIDPIPNGETVESQTDELYRWAVRNNLISVEE